MQSVTLTRRRPGPIWQARLRGVPARTWAQAGLALLVPGALIGYLALPTYPTYDSFYALLWGRDLLHGHLPDLRVYRGPTEHPLAIAFGMVCSIFGQGGARLMVLGSIGSFVALVAGIYRVGRICFGALVGALAALLVLSRFFAENLATQGYLDISYVALVVWALALELARARRGWAVFLLLAAAGLLRPDAWVLAGAYWLWCAWPVVLSLLRGARLEAAQRTRLAGYALAAASAPLVWISFDAIVTGQPLYSLHATAGLAQELERTQGLSNVVTSVWTYAVRIDKLPVLIGALAGGALAVWLTPRRAALPLAVIALQVAVFLTEGALGASVIDRYMLGAATSALLFCAVAIGGWSLLEPGSLLRRAWMVGAAALIAAGVAQAVSTVSLDSLRTTLAYHEEFHRELAVALHDPRVRSELARCELLSLPNNKLIPDARWILDTTDQRDIVARSQARSEALHGSPQLQQRLERGSVAVYPLGEAVFVEAIVDVGDDARDQVPPAGSARIYTSRYYAVYGNC